MIVCGLCILSHIIGSLISHFKTKKMIAGFCETCKQPIYQDQVHNCDLSDDQLLKLVEFVKSIKENGDVGNGK